MKQRANVSDDRRQGFRLDMEKSLVDISWLDEKGLARQGKVICIDFSRNGIKLDCDQSLLIDTQVSVIFDRKTPLHQALHGTVIRCKTQANGWFEIALQWNDQQEEVNA
jgi:hypothetical protein